MKSLTTGILVCCSGLLVVSANAAEWHFDADADPTMKYDDNELLRENERGDFSLSVAPTISLSRALENSKSKLDLGYRVSKYDKLSELDKQNPFAGFTYSHNTERSELGLALAYSERETRSIAEEDTGNFSDASTVTTKSISPTFSYRITELDSVSSRFSYTERTYDSSASNTSNLSDNETLDFNVAWQHRFSERFSGGLSAAYVNYEAESELFKNQYDSYSLSATSSYNLSQLWQLSGQFGMRVLDSEVSPISGARSSERSNGSTYSFSAVRKDELSEVMLSFSKALLPSSTGAVNEQDAYQLSYSRDLSEQVSAGVSASYRDFDNATDDFSANDETKYSELSPYLRWKLDRNLALVFNYKYRNYERSQSSDATSNAIYMTIDYDWDGIRFSR